MSRDLIFRAFDNLKKEMIYKVSVFESCAFKNNVHLPTLNGDKNYFINQFVGMSDKNGVMVYEDDITKEGNVIKFNPIKSLFCEYSKNQFTGDWNMARYPLDTSIIEVIGNIHENPELLCTSQST